MRELQVTHSYYRFFHFFDAEDGKDNSSLIYFYFKRTGSNPWKAEVPLNSEEGISVGIIIPSYSASLGAPPSLLTILTSFVETLSLHGTSNTTIVFDERTMTADTLLSSPRDGYLIIGLFWHNPVRYILLGILLGIIVLLLISGSIMFPTLSFYSSIKSASINAFRLGIGNMLLLIPVCILFLAPALLLLFWTYRFSLFMAVFLLIWFSLPAYLSLFLLKPLYAFAHYTSNCFHWVHYCKLIFRYFPVCGNIHKSIFYVIQTSRFIRADTRTFRQVSITDMFAEFSAMAARKSRKRNSSLSERNSLTI